VCWQLVVLQDKNEEEEEKSPAIEIPRTHGLSCPIHHHGKSNIFKSVINMDMNIEVSLKI
jgi:hypothetical protein